VAKEMSFMSGFQERKEGFEAKFAHEQEQRFKAVARRNHALGLWAADLMGMDETAAAEYATTVIKADFEEPGDDDVLRKVAGDLADHGSDLTADDVRVEMDRLMAATGEHGGGSA
jgi:hypothetical protein